MPMKGIFNQKNQNIKNNQDELDKQILRINTLEVHMKNLLKFENEIRSSIFRIDKQETTNEFHSYDQKLNKLDKRLNKFEKTLQEFLPSIPEARVKEERLLNLVDQRFSERLAAHVKKEEWLISLTQELDLRDQKLDKLNAKLNQFEQTVREIILFVNNKYAHAPSMEEEKAKEERLANLVEQRLSGKLAPYIKNEEALHEQIRSLESRLSKLMEQECSPFNSCSTRKEIEQPQMEETETSSLFSDRESRKNEELDETDAELFSLPVQMRVMSLEQNYLLVNEVQAGLLKRVDELTEKWNKLMKEQAETEDSTIQQEPVFKTLYIDKLYLDKYEQNNNFEQLGIKSLSGALNIGATYGKETVPKEITEQVKEDIEKMKEAKEEIEESQTSTEEQSIPQNDEASNLSSTPSEDELSYTDIEIEDGPGPF